LRRVVRALSGDFVTRPAIQWIERVSPVCVVKSGLEWDIREQFGAIALRNEAAD
jgi:hypothetical protein